MYREIDDTFRGRMGIVDHADFWGDLPAIRAARPAYVRIENHPMLGKTVVTRDGRNVTITEAAVQYYDGYYIVLLYVDDKKSHGMLYYGNLDCQALPIIKAIDADQRHYNIP